MPSVLIYIPFPQPFHTFPLVGSQKQAPAVGSQVPGTRHPVPETRSLSILHHAYPVFRSVSQAFRLIALLPYCPIALPRPGTRDLGPGTRVPEWKAGSGSDNGIDDDSGESPSRPGRPPTTLEELAPESAFLYRKTPVAYPCPNL